MAVEAKQNVQINVGTDVSTVTFGGSKIEVSADGKKVTAYTSDGVETKAATNGAAAAEGTLISVGKDFNTVVLNGVTIERAADNHLVISAPGAVITKPGPSDDSKKTKTLEVGDKMEDGTIFAGVSPDTGRDMFVTPKDAPGVLKWEAAMKYAADLDANGHKDWRLPTEAELDVLYKNRDKGALKGTFDASGSKPSGWYWSATEAPAGPGYPDDAWMERFSDGYKGWYLTWKVGVASARPVRSELRP